MKIRTTLLSLAMVALACAGAGGSEGAPDFQPTGGIVVASGNGARFNANQVVGPKVHIKQRSDGSWGGTINAGGSTPTPIDATFEGGQFVGANIRLSISRDARQTTIVGSVLDRIVRVEVTATEIRVRTGTRSENFVKLAGPGEYGGSQSMKLEGEAQQAPPTPAFALAMIGAFI
ncbi:MAG: hypothetical protein EHM78_09250 [Myxococcaceae bacterium]|nr:MAG: hypothetical protein EHM78_09250 [Myxococcaceae bacterium]